MKFENIVTAIKQLNDKSNFTVQCDKESDFYGTSFIINFLNNNSFPLPLSSKTFKHGWIPNRMVKYPKQILHWGTGDEFHICFNNFQKDFLEQNGYSRVVSAGAPYLYAEKMLREKPKRIPNSLLIMPSHTLSHIGGSTFFKNFFDNCLLEVKNLRSTNISICIHQESYNSATADFFSKNNISIIKGAKYNDCLSLVKQVEMLNSYEYVITNALGSHILYALYSGCKVKVIDLEKPSLEEILRHQWYKENQDIAEHNLKMLNQIHILYPEIFQGWTDPEIVRDLVNDEIGVESFRENLRSVLSGNLFSGNLKDILKWNIKNNRQYNNFFNYFKTDRNQYF